MTRIDLHPEVAATTTYHDLKNMLERPHTQKNDHILNGASEMLVAMTFFLTAISYLLAPTNRLNLKAIAGGRLTDATIKS